MSEGRRGLHWSAHRVIISQRAPPPVFLLILKREADANLIVFCDILTINGIQNLILFPNSWWANLWVRFITLSSSFCFFLSLVFFTGLINSASQQANPVRFQLFLFSVILLLPESNFCIVGFIFFPSFSSLLFFFLL